MAQATQSKVGADKVEAYEAVANVFEMVFREVKEQAKKKPESTLNAAKVRILNKVLADVRVAVEQEPESKYLEPLDDETLPQLGDAVIIMAQYEAALKSFEARHHGWDPREGERRWFVEDS